MTDPGLRSLPRVAVCGAEHAAIAMSLARAGCRVTLLERDPHDLARIADGISRLDRGWDLVVTGDAEVAAGCDVILGSGPEASVPDVPFLSLDWDSKAQTALHLSALPGRAPLLEVLGPDARGVAGLLGQVLGAEICHLPREVVPPSQRLAAVLSAEIEALLLGGATPEEVDEALDGAGFAPGPFELQDLVGVDTCLVSRRKVFARLPGPAELPLFARAVAEGRLGRKVGVGWYRYPGGGGKVEDPLVEDMAIEEARFAGLSRAALDAGAIRTRVIATLRAEAASIAEEGGLSAAEVDDVAQLAIGAPPRMLC